MGSLIRSGDPRISRPRCRRRAAGGFTEMQGERRGGSGSVPLQERCAILIYTEETRMVASLEERRCFSALNVVLICNASTNTAGAAAQKPRAPGGCRPKPF